MNVTIIGSGYVGLVSGACLADSGQDVIFYDIDSSKIEKLKNGEIPIYEPGLEEVINNNLDKITFTDDEEFAFSSSQVIMSAVGTPMGEFFEADLTAVKAVAKTFSKYLNSYKIFVNKSTVPVGTGDMVKKIILENGANEKMFDVVSNPEFLREGCAIEDFQNPERIVIGIQSAKAKEILQELYQYYEETKHSTLLFMDIKSSELTKYAANSMLATRISFMNEIANYCDIVGANVENIAKGIGLDSRIGPKFLQAGSGYGGSCFPKDVAALIHSGDEVDFNFSVLNAVENSNKLQRILPVKKLQKNMTNLEGKTVAMLGIAFKPDTDDIREASSIYCIKELLNLGARVVVYDPIAMINLQINYPNLDVVYAKSTQEALNESDCAIVITEWNEFRELKVDDFEPLTDKVLIDGRNIYLNNIDEFKAKLVYENVGNN